MPAFSIDTFDGLDISLRGQYLEAFINASSFNKKGVMSFSDSKFKKAFKTKDKPDKAFKEALKDFCQQQHQLTKIEEQIKVEMNLLVTDKRMYESDTSRAQELIARHAKLEGLQKQYGEIVINMMRNAVFKSARSEYVINFSPYVQRQKIYTPVETKALPKDGLIQKIFKKKEGDFDLNKDIWDDSPVNGNADPSFHEVMQWLSDVKQEHSPKQTPSDASPTGTNLSRLDISERSNPAYSEAGKQIDSMQRMKFLLKEVKPKSKGEAILKSYQAYLQKNNLVDNELSDLSKHIEVAREVQNMQGGYAYSDLASFMAKNNKPLESAIKVYQSGRTPKFDFDEGKYEQLNRKFQEIYPEQLDEWSGQNPEAVKYVRDLMKIQQEKFDKIRNEFQYLKVVTAGAAEVLGETSSSHDLTIAKNHANDFLKAYDKKPSGALKALGRSNKKNLETYQDLITKLNNHLGNYYKINVSRIDNLNKQKILLENTGITSGNQMKAIDKELKELNAIVAKVSEAHSYLQQQQKKEQYKVLPQLNDLTKPQTRDELVKEIEGTKVTPDLPEPPQDQGAVEVHEVHEVHEIHDDKPLPYVEIEPGWGAWIIHLVEVKQYAEQHSEPLKDMCLRYINESNLSAYESVSEYLSSHQADASIQWQGYSLSQGDAQVIVEAISEKRQAAHGHKQGNGAQLGKLYKEAQETEREVDQDPGFASRMTKE